MLLPSELQSRVDQHILNRPDMNRTPSIRMSTAGFCPRRMVYDQRVGSKNINLKTAMRLLTGEPIHQFYREMFTEIFGNDFVKAEEEVSLSFETDDGSTFEVLGHPDGMIASANAIIEVKSVGQYTFEQVFNRQAPIDEHLEQGNIYAHALTAEWVLFIYHNRNDGDYLVLMAPYSEVMAKQTIEKWRLVERCARTGDLPPRPHHDASSSPCVFCDHAPKCYEGYAEQVAGGRVEIVTDPEICGLASSYRISRRNKLHYTKEEEGLKSLLAHQMVSQGLKLAAFSWGEVGVKPGKNNNPIVSLKETSNE